MSADDLGQVRVVKVLEKPGDREAWIVYERPPDGGDGLDPGVELFRAYRERQAVRFAAVLERTFRGQVVGGG